MTREGLINFGEMFLEVNKDSKNSNTYEFIEKALELLKQEPCEELPSVTPTQRWIPCNKQLPNIKNRINKYLVTLKDGTVCDALFTECDGNHWWNYNYDDVIAWQELPKAYKANMENKK